MTKLVSRGGRPSNPKWTIRRLVPFAKETWKFLKIKSKQEKISPAQLAATIIEEHINEIYL